MVGMPRKRPRDKFGTSQGHPGCLGRFVWKFLFKRQNVRGTYDGTDGTFPRDRRDTHTHTHTRGCLAKILYVYCFFRVRKKGSFGKGVFWKRGLFRKAHILEILENPPDGGK